MSQRLSILAFSYSQMVMEMTMTLLVFFLFEVTIKSLKDLCPFHICIIMVSLGWGPLGAIVSNGDLKCHDRSTGQPFQSESFAGNLIQTIGWNSVSYAPFYNTSLNLSLVSSSSQIWLSLSESTIITNTSLWENHTWNSRCWGWGADDL